MRRALEGLEGVKKAEISFVTGRATVYFEDGKVTLNQMIQAVNRVGFGARNAK